MRVVISLLCVSWLWCMSSASAELTDARGDNATGVSATPSGRSEIHASQDESEKERLRRRLEKNRRHLRGEPVGAETLPLSSTPQDEAVLSVYTSISGLQSEYGRMSAEERVAAAHHIGARRDAIIRQINWLLSEGRLDVESAQNTIAMLETTFPAPQ